jgi:sugar (pentulose or hexulose) kinase
MTFRNIRHMDGGQAMDGELVIGIDIGTTNLKAGLYDRNLDLVRSLKIAVTDMAGADAGAWNAYLVWQHAQKMLTAILQEDERQRLVAIGITGMAESGCLLDKHNQPTTPILLWHDRRGMRQAAAWRPLMADRLRSISGMRMTSVRSLAKWRWLVDHGASVTDRWCGAPEWLALCMTGTWLTDRTLAARTGAYNVIEGDYCEEILALAGAPSSLFPPAHLAPAVGGEMRSDVAVNLRLPKGVLVAIAGHDDIVAAYGAGTGLQSTTESRSGS